MENMISNIVLLAVCFLSEAALLPLHYLIKHLLFYFFFAVHRNFLLAKLFSIIGSYKMVLDGRLPRYSYYRHGPLARTIVGQQQVQGIDYAYTLQGWLKGVNSTSVQKEDAIIGGGQDCGVGSAVEDLLVNARLQPLAPQYIARNSITFNPGFESLTADDFAATIDNTLTTCANTNVAGAVIAAPVVNLYDIGQDGVPTGTTANQVANDAFGFSLNYFTGDYKPINRAVTPFAIINTPLPNSNTGGALFNGNISSMAVNMPKLGTANLYGYRYPVKPHSCHGCLYRAQ
jgi:hypothetical protein